MALLRILNALKIPCLNLNKLCTIIVSKKKTSQTLLENGNTLRIFDMIWLTVPDFGAYENEL